MVQLLVLDGPDEGKQFDLTSGIYVIGKEASKCNVVLQDNAISRIHAKIIVEVDNVKIEDLNSKNGVYVRDKKIKEPTVLMPGEILRMGTCILKLNQEASRTLNDFTRVLKLKTGIINIGRDPSNDVVISHPIVSRFHARIITTEKKSTIHDLNSSNGTFVNGQLLKKPLDLSLGSLIQIGGYSYLFDGNKLTEYDETSGQVKLKVRHLQKTVNLLAGEQKKLLDNVNLTIKPKEFVAILGGSGAGKSTLMGSLTGMAPASSGEVLVNGKNLYNNYDSFRALIGYVPQDDIVHMDLTVKEVLTYSASLRLPDDVSKQEIDLRVEEVIQELELVKQKDVLVKNLSGGQRKRVSIGVELLTKPSLFFLDEPTSGLDPGLEKIMMELFRKLAYQGRTIILVTHATFNINLCDKVIFLTAGGKLAFFGSPKECLKYFNAKDFAEIYKKLETTKTPTAWATEFLHSEQYATHIEEGMEVSETFNANYGQSKSSDNANNKSFFRQLRILTKRYSHLIWRDRKNLFILLLQPIIIALLIIMVFSHETNLFDKSTFKEKDLVVTEEVVTSGQLEEVMENSQRETTRRKNMSTSIFLMVITAIWLGTSNASKEVVKEIPIYQRERLVNLRVFAYISSKVIILTLVCIGQISFLVIGITFGLGLPGLGYNLIAFFIIALASLLMGLCISALVSNTDKAVSTVPILLIPQILLSGVFVPQADIEPEFLQPIFNLAISKWGYELVGGGIVDINGKVALSEPIKALSGDFSGHWLVLFVFIIAFFLLSIYSVKRKDNLK